MDFQISSKTCLSPPELTFGPIQSAPQLTTSEKIMCSHISTLIDHSIPLFKVFPNSEPSCPQELSSGQIYRNKILTYNRKEKSLEELSKKFIQAFEGKDGQIIALDRVTLKFKVERRRIYDVINILESLKVVVKKGKNQYKWMGLKAALQTISNCSKLQNQEDLTFRKPKSLEALSSSFLYMFLHYKTAISLEEAAHYLLEDECKNSQVVKTKIRRLYDIVNVFNALGIVRRGISVDNGKKNGFMWNGVEKLMEIIDSKASHREDSDADNSDSAEKSTQSVRCSDFFCFPHMLPQCYPPAGEIMQPATIFELPVHREVLIPKVTYRANSAFTYFYR